MIFICGYVVRDEVVMKYGILICLIVMDVDGYIVERIVSMDGGLF